MNLAKVQPTEEGITLVTSTGRVILLPALTCRIIGRHIDLALFSSGDLKSGNTKFMDPAGGEIRQISIEPHLVSLVLKSGDTIHSERSLFTELLTHIEQNYMGLTGPELIEKKRSCGCGGDWKPRKKEDA